MKITRVYQKVRRNATRKWQTPGKTGLPDGRSVPEDWTPGTPSTDYSPTPSTEFSEEGFNSDGLPDIPLDGSEDKEPQYYRGSPRVVFFDEEVLVRRVRPVYKIGGIIDRRELWYQEDEYKEIMWKARRLVKRAHNDDDNTNTEKYCLRGLEHVTNSIKRQPKSCLDGREAVLDEQCSQFERDVFPLDDNRIAAVYLPFTKSHRAEAIERAKYDAEEVELYQQSPSTTIAPTPTTSSSSSRRSARTTTNASHSSHSSLQTPKHARSTISKSSSFASTQSSPNSPSVHKGGLVFTHINPGMKLDKL